MFYMYVEVKCTFSQQEKLNEKILELQRYTHKAYK